MGAGVEQTNDNFVLILYCCRASQTLLNLWTASARGADLAASCGTALAPPLTDLAFRFLDLSCVIQPSNNAQQYRVVISWQAERSQFEVATAFDSTGVSVPLPHQARLNDLLQTSPQLSAVGRALARTVPYLQSLVAMQGDGMQLLAITPVRFYLHYPKQHGLELCFRDNGLILLRDLAYVSKDQLGNGNGVAPSPLGLSTTPFTSALEQDLQERRRTVLQRLEPIAMLRAIVRQDFEEHPQSNGEQGAILAVTKAELDVLLQPLPNGLGCNLLSSWLAACRIRTGVERCIKSRPNDSKILASASSSFSQSKAPNSLPPLHCLTSNAALQAAVISSRSLSLEVQQYKVVFNLGVEASLGSVQPALSRLFATKVGDTHPAPPATTLPTPTTMFQRCLCTPT
jgi:hypothetical protein